MSLGEMVSSSLSHTSPVPSNRAALASLAPTFVPVPVRGSTSVLITAASVSTRQDATAADAGSRTRTRVGQATPANGFPNHNSRAPSTASVEDGLANVPSWKRTMLVRRHADAAPDVDSGPPAHSSSDTPTPALQATPPKPPLPTPLFIQTPQPIIAVRSSSSSSIAGDSAGGSQQVSIRRRGEGLGRPPPSALSTVLHLPAGTGLLMQSPSFASQPARPRLGLRRSHSMDNMATVPMLPTIAEKASMSVVELDATRLRPRRSNGLSVTPARY